VFRRSLLDVPTRKPREGVALLEGLGFAKVRQRGSRNQYPPTLLRKIAKDIGLTPEQLLGRE
jgi:predicted RNA binding protein YcfA (HicA-like mRNA interferase family)